MNEDMEDVFKRKVDEKQDRMKRLQRDEETRLEKEKKMLEEEKQGKSLKAIMEHQFKNGICE